MKLHLTREEFLALWRTHSGYTPSVCGDACVQRSDGMDLDSILMAEMEEWYRKLLLEADESLLAPEDIAADTAMPAPSGGSVTIHLPPGVLRVLCVRLSGWSRPACIVTDPDSPTAVSQLHPYTRACADSPVAVLHTDGSLSLYPAASGDRLSALVCAIRRDGIYSFDRAATDGFARC